MSDSTGFAAAYDAAFRARAPHLEIRPEQEADGPFLTALFVAASPLKDALPRPMLEQQAAIAEAHWSSTYPDAPRRIVTRNGEPVGRIILDWVVGSHSFGVDIAVLPQAAGQGVGSALLRAWLDTADAAGLPCRFFVFAANPARAIYRHLGFADCDEDPNDPYLQMTRPVGGNPAAGRSAT